MTLKITLSGRNGKGVDFNNGYDRFFTDFAPSGSPEFLGPTEGETTQIVHLATPATGAEAQARAVLLEGSDFLYTFSNHTISGELDTIRLVRLGDAYDSDTGQLVLEDGVVQDATPFITIDRVNLTNPVGEAGPVHEIVAGLMGGGPSGTLADPTPITDLIWAEAHDVRGSSGSDSYAGTRFGDTVRGAGGRDVLSGRGGDDTLIGGAGADKLTGGAGSDTFVYASAGQTAGDLIRDFDGAEGDVVDLSAIDANDGRGGNQRFSFIGDDRFSGTAGELRFADSDARTIVTGDTDGDGRADVRLVLAGDVDLAADDFLL